MAGYIGSKTVNLSTTGADIDGNITISGTVDGRDVAALGTKLDSVEANAKDDQTAAEIRALVAAASDSNVFTDADHSKLNGLEATGDVTDATNVAAAGALMRSGGAMTGAITTNSTFDGVDIATRDAVLTATTTTANAALPKSGGTMTGALKLSDVAQSIDFIQSGSINFDSNGDQTGRVLTIGSNRADGASGGTTNVTFSEDGTSSFSNNVGIGRSANSGALAVQAGTNAEAIHVIGRSSGDIGQINFFENDYSTVIGRLDARADQFILNAVPSIPLKFNTNNETRMTIEGSTGNVGIGVSDPTFANNYKGLEIGGNSNSVMKVSCTVSSGWSFSEYAVNDTTKWITGLQGNVNAYRIAYGTNLQNDAKLSVMSDGKVGIGTISPDAPLKIFQTGLTDGSTSTLLHLHGQFAASSIDDRDRVAIKFTSQNSGGGLQSSNAIKWSYPNKLYLMEDAGDVYVGETIFQDDNHIKFPNGNLVGYAQTSGVGGTVLYADNGSAGGALIQVTNAARGWANFYVNRIWSAGADARIMQFTINGSGVAGGVNVASASTIAFATSSDYRLKENVVYDWDATTRLKQLKPARFNFILDGTDVTQDGFMAHEAQEVVPIAVSGAKDAMKDEEYEVTPAVLDDDGVETEAAVMGTRSVINAQSIDHSKLVPLLVKTIQELEARITALEA